MLAFCNLVRSVSAQLVCCELLVHRHRIFEGAFSIKKNQKDFGFAAIGHRQLSFKSLLSDAGFDFFLKITPPVRNHRMLKFAHFVEATQRYIGQLDPSLAVEPFDRGIGRRLFFPMNS